MTTTTIDNPLPQKYLCEEDSGYPGVGGILKVRPDDFLVEELPLYEPCGEGEHLYLRIQKNGLEHGEMMAHLRRLCAPLTVRDSGDFGIPPTAKEAAAFAVMADRAVHGRPNHAPEATGARGPRVLGKILPR